MGTPSNIDFVGLRWQKAQWIADDQGRPVLSVPRDQECGACRFKINTAHQKGCPSMEDSIAPRDHWFPDDEDVAAFAARQNSMMQVTEHTLLCTCPNFAKVSVIMLRAVDTEVSFLHEPCAEARRVRPTDG
jgi:hypothetical protein